MRWTLIVTILCLLASANAKSTRIVNGQNVTGIISFYAYVEMHRELELEGDAFFGGGTLITQQAVLTVAQNVIGFLSWEVGVGATQIPQLQHFIVASAVPHPDFSPVTLANNIAVLRLLVAVPISVNTLAASRPPAGFPIPQETATGSIYGFGFGATFYQPYILQQASLTVLTQAECGVFYPHLVQSNILHQYFCANNIITGANICAGDQGGPFFSSDMDLVVGVQSFNRVADCTSVESQPAAFLRVNEYAAFINANLVA